MHKLCWLALLCAWGCLTSAADVPESREIKQVFLTGGSGYLGRNYIRHFVAKGVVVHAIARSDSALQVVRKLGAIGFKADLSDTDGMRAAAEGCDVAIHAAAHVKMWGDLAEARIVTVNGTRNVMAAAVAAGVRRVVHVGTEAGCVDASASDLVMLDESAPLPDNPFPGIYSTTKNEAEREALAANSLSLEVVVVRPRFIWGRDDTVLLPALAAAAKSGDLKWFDGGEYKTSTCHVDNVVEGTEKAVRHGKPGHAYFLTDGEPVVFKPFISRLLRAIDVAPPTANMSTWLIWPIANVLEWACTLAGCEPPISRQALALIAHEVTVSDAKARRELGYIGHMTIDDGIRQMISAHEENVKAEKLGGARVEL